MAVLMIPMMCADCCQSYSVGKYRARDTINRVGVWVCKSCSNTRRNKERAKAIGTTRVHAQSGYIEEKTENGWRRQHIAVMERHLGRRLLPNEVVHHKNEVKTDNRVENLEVMEFGEHTRAHNLGKKFSAERRMNIRNAIAKSVGLKTNETVFEQIREIARNTNTTRAELARQFGISQTAVYRAIHRKAWQ